ncbi:MAG: cell division protein ZapA [Pseudomonadota bacterium]
MPQVAVVINGKTYRMACSEGEEAHLLDLAKRFDGYVGHLKEQFGEIGDQRLGVMAGIMVTDELHELQRKARGLEAEVAELRDERDKALEKLSMQETRLTSALNKTAERVEGLATRLTEPVAG